MESRLETPTLPRPGSFQNILSLAPGSDFSGEALAAIERVGPRTYTLQLEENQTECQFLILGCHGNGGEDQKAVAKLMDDVIGGCQQHPLFILFLGDNVYDWGVNSPISPDFEKVHDSIYTTPHLKDLPKMMLLGNHDENFQTPAKRMAFYKGNCGYDIGKNEVAHTYAKNPNELITLFSQETLNPKDLGSWVMPYFFYSIIVGNTQIFCLDSNTFLGDFYNYRNNIGGQYPNQAKWLVEEYQKARDNHRQVFIAQHHPLSTDGKRSNPDNFDSRHYYSNEDIRKFNAYLGTRTYSFNQLLAAAFKHLEIFPDLVCVAHDHFIRYENDTELKNDKKITPIKPKQPTFRQLTAGGGGGELQHRVRLDAYPNVACHFSQHGFGLFTIDTRASLGFTLDIFTTKGLHLRFNEASSLPVCIPSPDSATEAFKIEIRERCDQYLRRLQDNQKPIIDNYNEPAYKTVASFVLQLPMTFFHHAYESARKVATKSKKHLPTDEHNMIIIHDIVGLIDQHHSLALEELKSIISTRAEELDEKEIEDSIYQQLKQILNPLEQLNTFSMN